MNNNNKVKKNQINKRKNISKLNNIFSNNTSKIIFLSLILILNIPFISHYKLYFIESNSSNITLKIKGKGNRNVYSPDYKEYLYPDMIYINSHLQDMVNYSYYFEDEENFVELVWNIPTNGSGNLFKNCYDITEIDFSNFDSSLFVSMSGMFDDCNSLTSLNLSNFDTSQVTNMQNMFYSCLSLTTLDLSSFDTSLVTDMKFMFLGCTKLISLNLYNFNTSLVEVIDLIFYNCSSLISLNISSFDVSKITSFSGMFYNCASLTSLNLSNFYTYKLHIISQMFEGCANLRYINLKNLDESQLENDSKRISNIFDGVPENVVICLNDNITKNIILPQLKNKTCYVNDCSDNWKKNQLKLIPENNTCVPNYDDDIENNNYRNETIIINENNIIQLDIDSYDKFLNETEKYFTSKDYNTIIIDNGEDQLKEFYKLKVTFTTLENQKNNIDKNNLTAIDLGECEFILKDFYNISYNETLYMRKLDIIQEGMKIPKMEYDVYHKVLGEYLEKLNLNVCKDEKASLYIPIEITENIDILNSSSGYYNDICYTTTSEFGTDISLKDRKNDFIEKNKTICQEDCILEEYNTSIKKTKCSCDIKQSSSSFSLMNIDIKKLYKNFKDIKNIINFNILICVKRLFSKEGLSKNFAFYFLMIILIFHGINIFIFYRNDLPIIKKKIEDLIYGKKNLKLIKDDKEQQKEEGKELNTKEIENKINDTDKKEILPPPKKKFIKKRKIKRRNKNNNIILENQVQKDPLNINDNNNTNIKHNNYMINNNNKDIIIDEENNKDIIEKVKKIMEYNDDEINVLSYELALKFDKRVFSQYYISLVKTKHAFIFDFLYNKDYNSRMVKIDLLFIGFIINYTVNALFYDDGTMHKLYEEQGSFNFVYQLPKIIYSSLISIAPSLALKLLSLSNDDIVQFKQNKSKKFIKKKGDKLEKKLGIKFIIYFILSSIFLLFFWYYLSMFGAIYKNTQYHLLKDTLISFILSLIYPFGIYLLPGLFRIPALSDTKKEKEYLYKFSKILQIF